MKRQTGLFSGSLTYFIFSFINYGIRLAVTILVARSLGTDGKGIYTLILLSGGFVTLFSNLGLSGAITYLGAAQKFSQKALFSFGLVSSLVSAVVGNLVFLALYGLLLRANFLSGVTYRQVYILCGYVFFNLIISVLTSLLLTEQKILSANVIETTRSLSNLMLQLAALYFHFGVDGAVLAWLGGSMIGLVIAIWLTRDYWAFQFEQIVPITREALRYGLKSYIANLSSFANYRLDSFLVNSMAGASQVGLYSVGVSLAEMTWYVPNAVSAALFPKVPTLDPDVSKKLTARLCRQILIILVPFTLVYLFIGSWLIPVIYGARFSEAIAPFVWLMPGMIALALAKIISADFAGRGKPQYATYSSTLTLVVTVVLDILLIPRLGITGAAIASSVAYSVATGLVIRFYMKDANLRLRDIFLPGAEDVRVIWAQIMRLAAILKRKSNA